MKGNRFARNARDWVSKRKVEPRKIIWCKDTANQADWEQMQEDNTKKLFQYLLLFSLLRTLCFWSTVISLYLTTGIQISFSPFLKKLRPILFHSEKVPPPLSSTVKEFYRVPPHIIIQRCNLTQISVEYGVMYS
jgi:hypothetical protein